MIDGPSLLYAFQTAWMATGVSLLVLCVLAAVLDDGAIERLWQSDDAYVAAIVLSTPVAVFYAIGTLAGWRWKSDRIGSTATLAPLLIFAAILGIAELLCDFREGDGLIGYLAMAICVGGLSGSIAFCVRSFTVRWVLSLFPHLLVGLGYVSSVTYMGN